VVHRAGAAPRTATVGAQGRSPRPTARAQRAKGAEKNVANTAPAVKRTPDAVDLLADDHLAVDALFKKYRKLMSAEAPAAERQALANTICRMLTAHARLEEEIFYPAARAAGVESDLMDEADIEHASAKALIGQIEIGTPDADQYDAKVSVLGEYIEHHVVEEHSEMFTKCRRANMDLVGLRTQMEARKEELMDPGLQPPVTGQLPAESGL
jgi:hemerythrin superfamily protein